jgi:FkbM family methyltransferase
LAPVKAREGAKRLARRLGYEVRPYTPLRSLTAARERLFDRLGVGVVVDVGANEGQYGSMLRAQGFTGRLISLEPEPEAFSALQRRAAADGAWTALAVAAADADGEVVLNVTADSRSSSVLARNERFTDKPGWTPVQTRRVPSRRLETLLPEVLGGDGGAAYLKLDVQGYERRVLDGAGPALERFAGLELELSVMALYEGQPALGEMLALLGERGFDPVSLEPILLDDAGRLMELDGVFLRRS